MVEKTGKTCPVCHKGEVERYDQYNGSRLQCSSCEYTFSGLLDALKIKVKNAI